MTCAKLRVVCIIRPRGQAPIRGENSCANPQQVCPRAPGEDYTKCTTICQQAGHAEVQALRKCQQFGAELDGATAETFGHYYACEDCARKLRDAGITKIVIHNQVQP